MTSRWIFLILSVSSWTFSPSATGVLQAGTSGRSAVFDTDQAHAAIAVSPEGGMIAEVRDLDADNLEGVDKILTRLNFHLLSVYKQFHHLSHGQSLFLVHVDIPEAVARIGHEFMPELVQITAHRHGAGCRKHTDGFHFDIVAQLDQQIDVGHGSFAAQQLFDDLEHPAKTFPAGSALAAGFMMVEIDEVLHELHHIHGFVKYDDAAGAKHGLVGGHGFVIEGGWFGLIRGKHRGGTAAGNHRF